MTRDPVCGTEIRKKDLKVLHKDREYFFCCMSCKWIFEKDPAKFSK